MRKLLLFIAVLASTHLKAQEEEKMRSGYPTDYFRNPLGIPILLAGNFGECRPNHFHSGIDIKTNGKENLPVYAAAEGYISRIKMEKGGFGHALYITHPKGYTTLYAHLNNFVPSLQAHLKKIQYQNESWAVDISLTPEQFPIKKGEQIAWSGNTGSSSAPHLHFEIRDSQTEHPLNPQLFGLIIPDTRPPIPYQISLYDLNHSIYNQVPRIINLRRLGSLYTTAVDTIVVTTDKLGIGINVNDFMNGSDNTLNFFTARWFVDNNLQGVIKLDDIGYDVTRYLHAYVDYKSRKQQGEWYQLLFQLPGNRLYHIYHSLNSKGAVLLEDQGLHTVKIDLTDAAGNSTSISLNIRAEGTTMEEDCNQWFFVKKPNIIDHSNIKFDIDAAALYDDVCFELASKKDEMSLSDRFQVHNPLVPIHKYFTLNLKPNKPVPFKQRDKVVMMYSDGKSEDGRAATFENGWYKASVRNFGTYWLTTDTTAPVVKPLHAQGAILSKASRISISVKEHTTSVKRFRAELDGKWISFEPKGDIFFYTFDEHCTKGRHKLTITASDENDNSETLVFTFTR